MQEEQDQKINTPEYVSYDEFKKMDIRVGTIKSVEPVEGTDKLLKCGIDFGEDNLRQIVSGIREYYGEYEKLIGKQVLYIVNLEPRTIKGVVSNGMLMAVDGKDGAPVFLVPEVEVNPGSHVR
jgi:methionyl-tRNA synthetase